MLKEKIDDLYGEIDDYFYHKKKDLGYLANDIKLIFEGFIESSKK